MIIAGNGGLISMSDVTDAAENAASVPATTGNLRITRRPKVYLVGRQVADRSELDRFLSDQGVSWQTDTAVGGEVLMEAAGRLCYMSFGKGRKTNAEFINHLIEVGHGSVLEHEVFSFLITDVSRSFTHELVRHRHFSYSQLSQRYVDESDAQFVEPDVIASDPALHAIWCQAVTVARQAYQALVARLPEKFVGETDRTLRRKLARQAARSVLPNATETKIFVTGNVRALRHFLELRGSEYAEVEIRGVALQMLAILRQASPNAFADYVTETLSDGSQVIRTAHVKV